MVAIAISFDNYQGLIKAVKKMHSLIETTDVEKQRTSQDNLGELLLKNKDLNYTSLEINEVPAEWVSVKRTHMKKNIILYLHGGGYISGSYKYARSMTSKLANYTSMDVLCVDYRLAPEHPFPASLEDALKAWDYLMYQGYGAENVVLAGDSAGGNLALILTLKLKEQNRMLPKGLVLFSPWTDLTKSGKSHIEKVEVDPILTPEFLNQAIESYASKEDLKNPYISPVFGDFKGFPPVQIQVGTNEILYSDAMMLQKQMQKCHVQVEWKCYRGMWHVFQMAPFKTAFEAMEDAAEFVFGLYR